MSSATGKCSRRIEKLLVSYTSSGVLTTIESDPRRRTSTPKADCIRFPSKSDHQGNAQRPVMRYPISAAIGAGAAAVLLLVAISTAAVRCTTKLAEPIARPQIAEMLPVALARVEAIHGRRFARPITVGVYVSPEAFAAANGTGLSGAVGLTFFGPCNSVAHFVFRSSPTFARNPYARAISRASSKLDFRTGLHPPAALVQRGTDRNGVRGRPCRGRLGERGHRKKLRAAAPAPTLGWGAVGREPPQTNTTNVTFPLMSCS